MRFCIVIILLLTGLPSLLAQQFISINDTVDQHIFAYHEIYFLEDSAKQLTIQEVAVAPHDSLFQPNLKYYPVNTNRQSAYWYRIKIKYPPNTQRNWVIEFFDQTIDRVEFYSPAGDGTYTRVLMGDELKFNERTIRHKNFIASLTPHAGEESTYFIRILSKQKTDVLIVVRAQSWLFQYALDEYFFFGIFYGMILVFGFYNLLMFIAVRERYYLYYILYLTCVGLYEMSADGIGFQYLWPDTPTFNYYASGIFLYLAATAALIFSSSVLNIRKGNKGIFILFVFVFIIRTLFLLLSLTSLPNLFGFRFIEILPFLTIYATSIYYYFFKNYMPARFLVMAYTVVAFAIVYKVQQYFGIDWKPLGELSHYSLGFSFIAEMLLLSLAISDKIRLLRVEKAKAQEEKIEQLHENQRLKDNLNKILEDQVRIKTAEILQKSEFIEEQNRQLEKANQQLEEQAEEISQINALLERDNIKLQHDVTEEKEARVLSKELSFEEFCAMHPDDDSWLKFLSDLKWRSGYACRKCSCTSFSAGRSPFSRRCTKCGYDESATAYTLLQNTHLPISKALYLIFLVYNSQGTISSHKLSSILGIRQSTCWSYNSRIKILLKEKNKTGHQQTPNGWSSLILEE